MFTHNINPVMFTIGPFEARWYGLAYVLTFLLTYIYLRKNKENLNISLEDVDNFLLQIILAVIIGARLFAVFVWNPSYYLSNPLDIPMLWKGGMSLHGGIIGVILVGMFFCKKHNISYAKLADILVIPGMIGLIFGRIANFINGEIVGTITDVSWCVMFPGYENCRHPVQLYAAFGRTLLVGFLFWFKSLKKLKTGLLFWSAMFLMGVGRFLLDFIREDVRYLGLSIGQYLSIILFVVSAIVIYKYYIKQKH